jgi:hypothetical protein
MNAPVPAAHARRVAIIDRDTPPIPPPLDERNPPRIGNASQPSLYKFEHWEDIGFDLDEEFLIDGILPRHGVGLLYGPSQSLKSFVAMHLGLSITQGQSWARRKAEPAPVLYIGAEGAAGLRKRKHGYVHAGRAPNSGVNFTLLSAAPNLGTAEGDHAKLITSIEASGIAPKLLIIDTIAKVIGGADENGAGMAQFLVNAQELAQHFAGFVLAVHHTGWNDEAKDRPRGWSGLPAALDVQILSERKAGEMSAILTVQKLKDEPSGLRLEAQMQRIVLGIGKTGREISTLIVDEVTELTPQATPQAPSAAAIPKTLRLLFAVLDQAIDDHGQEIQAFGTNGTKVRAVADSHVKKIYFDRIADKAEPDENPDKLTDRQRKNFKNNVEAALKREALIAQEHNGERFLWRAERPRK